MFQDLENKAYAVSFKAGSIGKGEGHKGERGSSGRGGGGDGRAYSHGKCLFELH